MSLVCRMSCRAYPSAAVLDIPVCPDPIPARTIPVEFLEEPALPESSTDPLVFLCASGAPGIPTVRSPHVHFRLRGGAP